MMPRPSPEAIEQWAVEKLKLPPRGSGLPLSMKTDRGVVRMWLRALGMPHDEAVMMTRQQLTDAWHNTNAGKE